MTGAGGAASGAGAAGAGSGVSGSCHCGAVRYSFTAIVEGVTACNCSICRRYGALWIYGHEGVDVEVRGATRTYSRGSALEFHHCAVCACIVSWRGLSVGADGRRRMAVNLRLCDDPSTVMAYPIEHFDGADTFEDLGRDSRCVRDMWF